jgi:lysophospholipase L1-like esterase
MSYSVNKKGWIACLLILMSFVVPREKKIKVWLIGDSTMCQYEARQFPINGWGMPFSFFFDSSVTIDNRAKGGRSTRTFIAEKRWQSVEDSLQEGDYVFIQFGHNDEATEIIYKDRYTPPNDYRTNLIKFINETKSKGANPVLITPVTRRKFDSTGHIMETHEIYSNIVRLVSKEMSVPLIDLDEKSKTLLQQFGKENSKWLFMDLEPNEHPNYPEGIHDNTHFTEFGARKMAEIVLAEVKALHLDLANHIRQPYRVKK